MFTRHNKKGKRSRGFTLIELLMCLVIIMIITFVVRSSKTKFERSIFLSNQAYDISLSVREAQVYATNVRRISATGSFDSGYGVDFVSGGNAFTLFADANNSHYFDASPSPADTTVRDYTIKSGSIISSICTIATGDLSNTCVSQTRIGITFKRPDSEACITTGAISGGVNSFKCVESSGISEARITLQASNGITRGVTIYATGQIKVD